MYIQCFSILYSSEYPSLFYACEECIVLLILQISPINSQFLACFSYFTGYIRLGYHHSHYNHPAALSHKIFYEPVDNVS